MPGAQCEVCHEWVPGGTLHRCSGKPLPKMLGAQCGVCHEWVPGGTLHRCSGKMLPKMPPKAPPKGPAPPRFPTSSYPNLKLAVSHASLSDALASKAGRHPSKDFEVSLSMEYTAEMGGSRIPWTSVFQLTELEESLLVTVRISTSHQGLGGAGDAVESRWKTGIESSWGGSMLIIAGDDGKLKTKVIIFEVEWVAPDHPGKHWSLDSVASSLPPPPEPRPTIPPNATYEERRKIERAYEDRLKPFKAQQVNIEYDVHGTDHMTLWGREDPGAYIHEFGHMIGCPDEYYTVKWNDHDVPGFYSADAFTHDSIMNNTNGAGAAVPGMRIYPRHFDVIRRAYEFWKGLPEDSTYVNVKAYRPPTTRAAVGPANMRAAIKMK
jgi:hypothetical protein